MDLIIMLNLCGISVFLVYLLIGFRRALWNTFTMPVFWTTYLLIEAFRLLYRHAEEWDEERRWDEERWIGVDAGMGTERGRWVETE